MAPDDIDLRVQYAVFLQPLDPVKAETALRDALRRSPDHVLARQTLATWLHGRDDQNARQEARELLQAGQTNRQQQASDRRLEAVLLLRRGRPADLESALVLLEQLAQETKYAVPEDRLLLGQLYERTANLAAAEEQLKWLANQQPGAARYVAVYCDFLIRHQRPDDARVYLEKLERLAPISLTAVSLRSRLLFASGQSEQIDSYLESFAQRHLQDLRDTQQRQQFMLQVAGLFAAVDRDAGAERWYRRLVAEFPSQRGALADFWLRHNQVPESLEFAMNEVQQEISPATAALLARVLTEGTAGPEQTDRAEAVFQEILQHDPQDPSFLFALASLRLKQGRIADAEALLRQLTELHPEHTTAWNNLAAILSDDPHRLPEAQTCIDRAIAAAGQPIANLLDTKAVILLQQHRDEEAAELLQQVISLADGQDPRFHFHFAVAKLRTGEVELAKQAWRRAREMGVFDTYLTGFEQQLVDQLKQSFDAASAGS